jgi:hypothetical protein
MPLAISFGQSNSYLFSCVLRSCLCVAMETNHIIHNHLRQGTATVANQLASMSGVWSIDHYIGKEPWHSVGWSWAKLKLRTSICWIRDGYLGGNSRHDGTVWQGVFRLSFANTLRIQTEVSLRHPTCRDEEQPWQMGVDQTIKVSEFLFPWKS